MKTNLIVGLFILVFIGNLSAQDESFYSDKSDSKKEHFIKYGIKAGYDMSPLTYNFTEISEQLKSGYQVGGFLQIGRTLYIQPEVYYASYNNPMSSVNEEKITTLRAPIMVGLRLLNLGIISLHLQGGPAFTALMSDVQSGFSTEKFTYNWQVGAGIDLFGFLTADLRYSLLNDVNISDQFTNFDPKTSTLNVTVGIKL